MSHGPGTLHGIVSHSDLYNWRPMDDACLSEKAQWEPRCLSDVDGDSKAAVSFALYSC